MTLFFQWTSWILAFSALLWCIWTGYKIWTTPVTLQGKSFSEISGLGITPLVIPVLITMVAVWATAIAHSGALMAAA